MNAKPTPGKPNNIISEANNRRIMACIEACNGISTKALEQGVVKELIGLAHDYKLYVSNSFGSPILLLKIDKVIIKAEGRS